MKTMKSKILFIGCFLPALLFGGCAKRFDKESALLHGIVSDAADNTPISGVLVTLSPGGKNDKTGSDGRYELSELEPRQYRILVQANGYRDDFKTVNAVVGEKTSVNFQMTKRD